MYSESVNGFEIENVADIQCQKLQWHRLVYL